MLLITAIIWGSAFVAQKAGATLEPFTYNGIRMLIGGLVLIPVIFLFQKLGSKSDSTTIRKSDEEKQAEKKTLLIGGICCGLFLCIASNFQQFGLLDTTAGKSGFITTLYVVLVPVFGLFLKKRAPFTVWIGIPPDLRSSQSILSAPAFSLPWPQPDKSGGIIWLLFKGRICLLLEQ